MKWFVCNTPWSIHYHINYVYAYNTADSGFIISVYFDLVVLTMMSAYATNSIKKLKHFPQVQAMKLHLTEVTLSVLASPCARFCSYTSALAAPPR